MFKKLFKRIIIIALLCAFAVNTASAADYKAFQDTLGREKILEITHDHTRYAKFTADGDMIYVEGTFEGASVEEFYISTSLMRNMRGNFERSGSSFSASFGGIPTESYARAVLTFADGSMMAYRVEYDEDKGWFFGDNGLGGKMQTITENYFTASPEIVELYTSATADEQEIRETLNELREIVAEVTADIDDDYEKARALNQWVADNIVYDRDARDTEVTEETVSLASTLRLRRSVCIGIANIYAALLEVAGIKAVNIKGGIVSPADGVNYEQLMDKTLPHEWVAFWYEKENRWVYTDPTWDRQGFYEDGRYKYRPSVIKHFDITPLALSFDHRADRAERRQWAASINNEPIITTPEPTTTTPEPEEDEPELTTTPAITTTPPSGGYTDDSSADNSVLFLIIGGMALLAAILVAVIIKNKK